MIDRKYLFATLVAASIGLSAGASQADGDPEEGKKVFRKCQACHAVEAGKNKIGPSLHGIVGKPAAQVEGFKYSSAMQESGLTWDEETLKTYLENPRKMVKGTRMAFAGLRKEEDLNNVIAYLKTLE